MLLGDGQGGTVDPLVNLFPFLCLEGVEPFSSVTHPGDTGSTESKVAGASHVCAQAQSGSLLGTGRPVIGGPDHPAQTC